MLEEKEEEEEMMMWAQKLRSDTEMSRSCGSPSRARRLEEEEGRGEERKGRGEEAWRGEDELSSLLLPSVAAENATFASVFARTVRKSLSADNSFVNTP